MKEKSIKDFNKLVLKTSINYSSIIIFKKQSMQVT